MLAGSREVVSLKDEIEFRVVDRVDGLSANTLVKLAPDFGWFKISLCELESISTEWNALLHSFVLFSSFTMSFWFDSLIIFLILFKIEGLGWCRLDRFVKFESYEFLVWLFYMIFFFVGLLQLIKWKKALFFYIKIIHDQIIQNFYSFFWIWENYDIYFLKEFAQQKSWYRDVYEIP